jgi:hypothetical protein
MGAKLRRAPAKKSSLADDFKAIAAHFGIASREAEAKHGGKTVDEAIDAPAKAAPAKAGSYDASSGAVEHAQNKAMASDSPGGEHITPAEREMIRQVAARVRKGS